MDIESILRLNAELQPKTSVSPSPAKKSSVAAPRPTMLARPVAAVERRRSPRRAAAGDEEEKTMTVPESRRRNPARQSHVIAPPSSSSVNRTAVAAVQGRNSVAAVGQRRNSVVGDRSVAEVQARVAVAPGQGRKTTAADRERNTRPSAPPGKDEQVSCGAGCVIY